MGIDKRIVSELTTNVTTFDYSDVKQIYRLQNKVRRSLKLDNLTDKERRLLTRASIDLERAYVTLGSVV